MKNNEQTKQDSPEPCYYMAFVIKGTKKQYLNLLELIDNVNGAQLLYQCKSLAYLRVYKDEGVNIKYEDPIALTAEGVDCYV